MFVNKGSTKTSVKSLYYMTNRIRKRTAIIQQSGSDPRDHLSEVDYKIHEMDDNAGNEIDDFTAANYCDDVINYTDKIEKNPDFTAGNSGVWSFFVASQENLQECNSDETVEGVYCNGDIDDDHGLHPANHQSFVEETLTGLEAFAGISSKPSDADDYVQDETEELDEQIDQFDDCETDHNSPRGTVDTNTGRPSFLLHPKSSRTILQLISETNCPWSASRSSFVDEAVTSRAAVASTSNRSLDVDDDVRDANKELEERIERSMVQ
ncbi:hypothetical protein Bhyg_12368 [Pseudolycoriella hygida]|uniref:Uncharacterized protein n=1 Tax=Pseudolycoriella hygida TaxID=35572 RepID=A0A9Q0MX34_9DIPT|nr:hypothetical protein Bhyg_12368 [Pseudolycoriella hygida]